jgi:succinate-acetate transporter protein
MAVLAEEGRGTTLVELAPAADPAPLGLAAFALTTFMLSGHNASFIPDILWVGLALFYGGLVQLLAGMWEFRNRNVFGSTAFSTYGGFWLALGGFVVLAEATKLGGTLRPADVNNGLAWFVLSFAIFNTYMMLWALRVNVAVFGVFLTLEITEILLTIGFFRVAHGMSPWVLPAGGWAGIVTAAFAWYASAAGVINGMSPTPVLPVGRPLWDKVPVASLQDAPMARERAA